MSDKWQAQQNFWSGFGIAAYDQASVPDDAVMPYITYTAITSSFEKPTLLTADLWYNSTRWDEVSQKSDAIGKALEGHKLLKVNNNEYIMLAQGTPFAQRTYDTNDSVKRIRINVMAEFFVYY